MVSNLRLEKNLDNKSKVKISPARFSAYEILLRIEKEKAYSSVLLPLFESELSIQDRSLCHELTLGILRKQIYLDKVIEIFTTKKLDLEVRISLRIGLYQLLFLDKIPAYSAINESVNLVQAAKKTSAKGFVNAILRRVSREKIELKFTDEIERISVETSHPRWLIEKWIGEFGFAETEQIAIANNQTPKMDFRFTAKTSEAIRKSFEQENIENEKAFLRDLAANGKIYFQDEGSQLVGQAVNLQTDERFLDVCAAPGSKLTQIAISSKQTVFGGDLHFSRVKLLKENAHKQGLQNVQILQYDAENSMPFREEIFDVILLDAPCSGTGTIRHNPEIRYHLEKKDFAELSVKQLKILENASKHLKRGGRLIYSTCSMEGEENEGVIEKFLLENEAFSKTKNSVSEKFQTRNGFTRTFPHRDKIDGFFIATLKKS